MKRLFLGLLALSLAACGADWTRKPSTCSPTCGGLPCGTSDGCGGTCGEGSGCIPVCTPSCTDKACGASDGCSGTCTGPDNCPVCVPSCTNKSCHADDGCGGVCNEHCCSPICTGKTCGEPDGCNGNCPIDSGCTPTCTPSCSDKACGAPDGCQGTCTGPDNCPACTPSCEGKHCGDSAGCNLTCDSHGQPVAATPVCDQCQPSCSEHKSCGESNGCPDGVCLYGTGCQCKNNERLGPDGKCYKLCLDHAQQQLETCGFGWLSQDQSCDCPPVECRNDLGHQYPTHCSPDGWGTTCTATTCASGRNP